MTRRAQRIVAEAVKEVRLPWSGTFHSIANRLIRRHSRRVGLEPGFSVLDRADAADLMDVVCHDLGLSKMEKRFPRKDTCLAIYSHRVNTQGSLLDTQQSSVHSAKGHEWDAVYLLNVADGSFPSEFATGRAELTEEERRLLYVPMTRAKSSLDLLAPVKYYVTQQSRMGDRHVYGATRAASSPPEVMACLEPLAWSDETTTLQRRSSGSTWSMLRRN